MLLKTRGIVLSTLNYAENSIIAKIYTDNKGLQSYLVNGVRSKKAKIKANIFQTFSLVEFEAYHKNSRELQRFSEIKAVPLLNTIHFDLFKSNIAFFLSEILQKVLREEEANPIKFEYIHSSIQILDHLETCNNFHISFLINLIKHLGFHIPLSAESTNGEFFDLKNGIYTQQQPIHPDFIGPGYSKLLNAFLRADFIESAAIPINSQDRRIILQKVIKFYELHHENWGIIKSLAIIQDVLH